MANKTSIKSTKAAKKAAAKRGAAKAAKPRKTAPKSQSRKVAKPTLLAGGNPQIAKADGDAPVQAYIAAMPSWKRDVGRRLDALIVRTVPGVRKAVKWNSPFYGIEGQGWFLSFHCFTKYVKVQAQGRALPRHPRGRAARRSSARHLGEASQPIARRTNVSGQCDVRAWRERTPSHQARSPTKATAKKLPAQMQCPRAEGNVQARIDLMPDWQTAHARRVDAVMTRQAPNVHKAIKWHGAGYGVPGVDAEIETTPNVISWFDIEDPGGNEIRWYPVLTSDTQVTGERQQP
jgi:hypothetical protein